MIKPRLTRKRIAALQWFKDHEEEPLAVLMKDRPSTKMCRLMAREKQVARLPTGAFGMHKWVLTYVGREALALSRRKVRGHVEESAAKACDAIADGENSDRQRSGA